MNSRNKTGSINTFDFDLGLGAKSMKDQKNQGSYYPSTAQQKPNTTLSRTQQANKPAWSHQPVGSLSGPTSMVGDIFGKSWNSSASSNSSVSGIGIVNSKNPNLFSDLLGPALVQNRSSGNAPLKSAGQSAFSMGSVADSMPKYGTSATSTGSWGSSVSNSGGNVNFAGNSNMNSNIGGLKNMGRNGFGAGGMGLNKDPFVSLVDFNSTKPLGSMKSASKPSDDSGLGKDPFGEFQNATSKQSDSAFPSSETKKKVDPMGDFTFPNNQANHFETLVPPPPKGSEDIRNQQVTGDDWGFNSVIGGGNDGAGTTELEGLPPPPAGVTASSAKNKGTDNYKQGQFANAIKWLSWAVVLFEKAGDDDGRMCVLTCRASCYKEVGEYKKAVADCTTVLEHDDTNVSVFVQRALLYESMEKYKLGADDLRTVMKLDPSNRLARSTIHRLTKMADQ